MTINEMITGSLVIVLLMMGFGIKLSKTEYMDKRNTDVIKGLCIVIIMFLHFSQRLTQRNAITELLIYSGGCTVGFFFFMTGYGFSVKHQVDYTIDELIKKVAMILKSLVLPLFFCLIIDGQFTVLGCLKNYLTLTMPPYSMWYLKVYIAIIFVLFATSHITSFNRRLLFIVLTCLVYMTIMIYRNYPDFWYNSVLCMPLGIWLGKYKDEIRTTIDRVAFLTPILIIGWGFSYLHIKDSIVFDVLSPLLFCLCWTWVTSHVSFESKILTIAGEHTLALYLWHLVFLRVVVNKSIGDYCIEIYYIIWLLLTIVVSILLYEVSIRVRT